MSRVMYFDDSLQHGQFVATQPSLNEEESSGYTEKIRQREPLWFCKIVTKRPHLWFGCILSVHTASIVLSLGLVLAGFDVFPVDFGGLPLNLRNQPWYKRELAFGDRFSFTGYVRHDVPPQELHGWPRSELSFKSLVLLYNAAREDGYNGNVFTKTHLQLMQRIEDSLVAVPGYKEDMCQLTRQGVCVPPVSVLRFFDGTYASVDPVFNDPDFSNISGVLYTAYTSNATKGRFLYFLGKSNIMSPGYVSVSLTRSILPFGGTSSHEVNAAVNFMLEKLQTLLDSYLETEQLEFTYYAEFMMIEDAKRQGFKDMYLAIGSTLFIFGFILFHTRSLWVTSLGVFGVVCSFAETNLIYRYLIGFRYFGFFHVMTMFIILGIGTDDLFVFWDAWRASELQRLPTLAHRLDQSYRKSCISMFITSLTTALAFAASALSPLLAIRSFGVFSAILVTIDYISVITFFPTIVIMYHLHFEKGCFCSSSSCGGRKQSDCAGDEDRGGGGVLPKNNPCADLSDIRRESIVETFDAMGTAGAAQSTAAASQVEHDTTCSNNGSLPSSHREPHTTIWHSQLSDEAAANGVPTVNVNENPANTFLSGDRGAEGGYAGGEGDTTKHPTRHVSSGLSVMTGQTSAEKEGGGSSRETKRDAVKKPSRRRLVIFFADYYLHLVTHKVWRLVLLAVLLAVVVVFLISAHRIRPDNKQVGLFKESHHYTRAFRLVSQGFVKNSMEPSITLWLVWGVKPRDLSSCHFSDYNCKGRQVFDSSFNPDTPAAQRSFMRLCDTLYNLSDQEVEDLMIRRDLLTGRTELACFTRDMYNFLRNESLLSNINVSMPWDATKLAGLVEALEVYFNASAIFNSSYPYYLDVPINYWLWDGYRQRDTPETNEYKSLIGEKKTEYSTVVVPDPNLPPVLVGNRIKVVAVRVSTTLDYATLSYTEHLPVLNRWEEFMRKQLSTMPPEMQGGFQINAVGWHWIQIQKSLVDSAILGLVLGVSLTLPILILSTCNVINGLLAALTICCVTVCVIGIIPMAGWKLGVLVSLNMCLVVGLAVDYVVHLAEGYHMSHKSDRKGRLKQALESMGISVFSGACTTLGASTFMLFAKIQFFYQFGIFMWSTIGFSLLFSMGLYVTIMGILGPENNVGDIRVPFLACSERLKNCQKFGFGYSGNLGNSQSTQHLLVDLSGDASGE